jgi:hypothetical protein
MIDVAITRCLRKFGGAPCLRIHGKARYEAQWRLIDVVATARRNWGSGWPLMQGTCITWTSSIIVVGWDFARGFLAEQIHDPASRNAAVGVLGGRLKNGERRAEAGASPLCSYSEVMAHECGHTAQAIRLGAAYLPLVGAVTLFREGNHFWNHWENDASAQGLMGGISEVTIPVEQWN